MSPSHSAVDTHELLENALGRPRGVYESRLRKIHWRKTDVILGLVVLLIWRLAMTGSSAWIDEVPQSWKFFLSAGFPALWMILFPYVVARHRGIRNVVTRIDLRHVAKEALITVPLVVVMLAGLAFLSSSLVYFGGEPLGTQQRTAVRSDLLALLILSVTVTPVAEELFFRGLLYNSFRRKSGIWVALIVQAGIFALIHPYNAPRMVGVFLLGLVFGALYEWRKTLISPLIAHGCINGVAALATLLVLLVQLSTPYLGVQGTATEQGYVIEQLDRGGPAEAAGMQVGDRLVKIADQPLASTEALTEQLRKYQPGDPIQVRAMRDQQSIEFQVTLKRRPRE